MKKIILIFISICIALNINAITKITPAYDTIYLFFDHNDTIILEPLGISPGTSLVSNFDEVGSEIYSHPVWTNLMAEYCKPKYKKPVPCQIEEEVYFFEKVSNKIFVIFRGKGEQELYALLNYEKFIIRNCVMLTCLNK